jgi:hypothetical protein
MASRLSSPGQFAASTNKRPAIATFFQKLIACIWSAKLAWKTAAEAIENRANAMAVQRTMASMYCWGGFVTGDLAPAGNDEDQGQDLEALPFTG